MAVRYGFFNAMKNTETGAFDRVYNNEDMTNFLRGVISQNGVFSEVGDQCKVSPGSGLTIVVGTGKALVNGHWVVIDAVEPISIDTPDIVFDRIDKIAIRWNDLDRTCSIYVTKGVPAYNPQTTPPEGYVSAGNWDTTNGITEIVLAYVRVKAATSTIEESQIDSRIGSNYCPYISHLVVGPSQTDVDKYLAAYRQKFEDWFEQVQAELAINTKIGCTRKVVIGGANVSARVPLNDIAGYEYEEDDIILPYYNGLLLTRGLGEWAIEVINNVPYLVIQGTNGLIEQDNVLEIIFMKGTALDLPDGNDIGF